MDAAIEERSALVKQQIEELLRQLEESQKALKEQAEEEIDDRPVGKRSRPPLQRRENRYVEEQRHDELYGEKKWNAKGKQTREDQHQEEEEHEENARDIQEEEPDDEPTELSEGQKVLEALNEEN